MTRLNKRRQLTVQYFGALHAAVMASCTDGAAEKARDLGTKAVKLGLDTLDLAQIHQQALSELTPSSGDTETIQRLTTRAAIFFNATLVPIKSLNGATEQIEEGLNKARKALSQRTEELAEAERKLKTGIAERELADANLKTSETKTTLVSRELRMLEEDLKEVTHKLLDTQEAERKKMSSRLHEEIAMTLLGIHVRLISLQKEVATGQSGLTREITTTRRLVDRAGKAIKHFNLEFGIKDDS